MTPKQPLRRKYLTCPCCRRQISPTCSKTLFKQIESLEKRRAIWWATDADQIIEKIDKFQWACDGCLRSGSAIIAHPEKQTFCDHPPFLAFFDKKKICSTCKEVFLFKSKEQEFWYETLRFWVQSEAKNCLTCRRKARERTKNGNERWSLMTNNNT